MIVVVMPLIPILCCVWENEFTVLTVEVINVRTELVGDGITELLTTISVDPVVPVVVVILEIDHEFVCVHV